MHPTPLQLVSEHLVALILGTVLLGIVLRWWFMPAPAAGPVLCPVCKGTGKIKDTKAGSKPDAKMNCPHCRAVGKVASYKSHTQSVRGVCGTCNGLAKIREYVGPVYPDGTPFPDTTSREIPCPEKACKHGFQTRKKTVHGQFVLVDADQYETELAMAEALVAAEKGAKA